MLKEKKGYLTSDQMNRSADIKEKHLPDTSSNEYISRPSVVAAAHARPVGENRTHDLCVFVCCVFCQLSILEIEI